MDSYSGNQKGFVYVWSSDESVTEQCLGPLEQEGISFYLSDTAKQPDRNLLKKAHALVVFLWKQSTKDSRLRSLITDAVAFAKPILCVFMEDVELDACLTMQTNAQQALFRSKYEEEESFLTALKQAGIFENVQVTAQQKTDQRNRGLLAAGLVGFAALLLFVLVLKPLLISSPASENNGIPGLQGLSKAELESITELHIIGNEVVDSFSHAWYEGTDRSVLYWDKQMEDGEMEQQETIPAGTISDLSDLKQLKNLQILQIEGQQIRDISPLFELEHLKELSLNCNPISSLEGIERLKNLTWLDLCSTDITDLSPLRSLENLKYVQLDKTNIYSLDALSGMKNLSGIQFNGTFVSEIPEDLHLQELWANGSRLSSVPDFSGIEDVILSLKSTRVDDISNISTAVNYSILTIDCNSSMDLSSRLIRELDGMTVRVFTVYSMRIDSIRELASADFTQEIHLIDCTVSSLEGIEQFTEVTEVELMHDTNLLDLSPLNEMENLETVTLSEDMAALADVLDERIEVTVRNDE